MAVYTKLTQEDFEFLIREYFGSDTELVSYDPISDGVTNTNYIVTTKPRKHIMSKREAIPFTNDFGQIINPGDEVVVVTTCTGSTYTHKGKYVGMSGKSVQAEVPSNSWAYFVKGTDDRAPANFHKPLYESGFKWNTPEWKALREEVYGPYEYRQTGGTRITTLQYNRIYKLAAKFSGKEPL